MTDNGGYRYFAPLRVVGECPEWLEQLSDQLLGPVIMQSRTAKTEQEGQWATRKQA